MIPPVLHRDRNCLVIDKPAGLAVHPGPRTPDSLERLLPSLRTPDDRHDPQPAHRLDRDTSGCLLLARGPAALRALNDAFAARRIGKLYWAIVRGDIDGEAGVVDAPLAKVSTRADGWRMVVAADGKPARTAWRLLARSDVGALVAFEPETGRTHQIRVHATLLGRGCAIAGDPIYGRSDVAGMMLHARSLSVPAIRDSPAFEIAGPAPAAFSRFPGD